MRQPDCMNDSVALLGSLSDAVHKIFPKRLGGRFRETVFHGRHDDFELVADIGDPPENRRGYRRDGGHREAEEDRQLVLDPSPRDCDHRYARREFRVIL